MGITFTNLILKNPAKTNLVKISVQALVNTGAMHLCIPEHIALQLQLSEHEKREITLADGSKKLAAYVGPIEIHCLNRRCFVGAMVLGDEVLLGAIPMEDMDLIVHPLSRQVLPNPLNPNIAGSLAKQTYF